MTSKQRAYLRGMANTLDTVLQIGKGGITQPVLRQIDETLEKRELIKVRVLETAMLTAREACNEVCEELGCEGIQAIGTRFVIYRESATDPKIELPTEKKRR